MLFRKIVFLFFFIIVGKIGLSQDCNALKFDGFNDYIQSTSLLTGNVPLTVEMWFQSNSTTSGDCSNSSLANFKWLIGWDDNQFGIGDCNGILRIVYKPLCPIGTGLCSSLPMFDISDGNWHHVAVTKGAGEIRIFIDGSYFTNFSEGVYDLSGTFRIGSSGNGNVGRPWEGLIDEVRIWDYKRVEKETSDSYMCQLSGDEQGLITYYNFNQGIANGTNTAETIANDLTVNNNDGALNNFDLTGSISNWTSGQSSICTNCESSCPQECSTDVVNISTGWDALNNQVYGSGNYDAYWTLVEAPNSLSVPTPAYVLTPSSAWNIIPNTAYISAFPVASLNTNNPSPDAPYGFEMCFCVCEDESEVTIDISALADNNVEIYLKGTATPIPLLSITATDQSAFHFPAETSTTTMVLSSGTYCIRADVRNLSGVAMGLDIDCKITGASLETTLCCNPNSSIIGTVYNDSECDGSSSGDSGLENWEVTLCDSVNTPISTIMTDAQGYYSFTDVPPGNYIIKETLQGGWSQSEPSGGSHTVVLGMNEVKSGLNFGNCIKVSTDDLANFNQIQVFPNPTFDELTIETVKPIVGKVEITLYNVTGQVMDKLIFDQIKPISKLSLDKFGQGVFLIEIKGEKGVLYRSKIIKM